MKGKNDSCLEFANGASHSPAPPPDGPPPTGREHRDPYPALRFPGFRRFVFPNFLFLLFRQGLAVAIAWQVYQWTHSAAAIGFIGFVNVIPLLLFVLPAGVLADRVDRRKINFVTMGLSFVFSVALVLCTQFHDLIPRDNAPLNAANDFIRDAALFFTSESDKAGIHFDNIALPIVFLLQFLHSAARVIGNPARAALIPQLVPQKVIPNAFILNSTAFELSSTLGPPLGGLIAGLSFGGASVTGFTLVYALDALFSLLLAFTFTRIKLNAPEEESEKPRSPRDATAADENPVRRPPAPQSGAQPVPGDNPGALAGVSFIWKHKPVLAAITLDLFAVLLGGVVALYPIYAESILASDYIKSSLALGLLRGALPCGAFIMALVLVRMPPFKRPGRVLLWTVFGFGAATLVFAVSKSLPLSLAALFLSGMCDNVSVVIRHTLVQMLTPNHLRGRVTSVNQLFIGSSNEISEFRGGMMAAGFGARAAASIGAWCILGVVGAVGLLFPGLRKLPPLQDLKPEK
ncbi:MAG: MFS transporter [Puniceicoccales bacterium]|jgi:MFS family permease|nr:MFS transporter [Puniceicoccales bacterium]